MKTKHHPILPSTKSCRRKFATYRMRFGLAFGSFVGLVLCTVSPSVVRAECSNWDVTGTWEIKQSNGASITVVVVKKSYGFNVTSPTRGGGSGSGNITGNDFFMEIGWFGGTDDGVYRGKIRSSGRIEGTAYNAGNHPEVKVTWFSASVMKCADAAPASAPAPVAQPKPVNSDATKAELSAAGDAWINQELRKRKTAAQPTPSPEASSEAGESSSNGTEDHHKKKKKKHNHHHDED